MTTQEVRERAIQTVQEEYRNSGLNEDQVDFLGFCWRYTNGDYLAKGVFNKIAIDIVAGVHTRIGATLDTDEVVEALLKEYRTIGKNWQPDFDQYWDVVEKLIEESEKFYLNYYFHPSVKH